MLQGSLVSHSLACQAKGHDFQFFKISTFQGYLPPSAEVTHSVKTGLDCQESGPGTESLGCWEKISLKQFKYFKIQSFFCKKNPFFTLSALILKNPYLYSLYSL